MYYIKKEFKFSAAHMLEDHDGDCARLHGHNYKVGVCLESEALHTEGPQTGMVLDFKILKDIWKEHLEPLLDHQYLNETLPIYTTAENIAKWICDELARNGLDDLVYFVEVWETDTCAAAYSP